MTHTQEQTKQVITPQDLFEKLCTLHREINLLSEDVKELLLQGKESDLDAAMINSIAKSYVKDKVGELGEKAELTLEMIEELTKQIDKK